MADTMYVSVKVLEKFGFLCALFYAAWLYFVDLRDCLAGGGSLSALIISVSAGVLGTAFVVYLVLDRTAADELRQRPE